MLRNRRNEIVSAAGDLTASTIVRLEDIQYLRSPRKPKDVTRTALYEALNTVETLPRIRALRRSRNRAQVASEKQAKAQEGVIGRLWRWVSRKA